jgi:NitT/TauT family transport system substrate-binding protein
MNPRSIASLCLLAALALRGAEAFAAPFVVGALKGPTGIGLVRLFQEAPVSAEGNGFSLVAVPSADLMAAKVISGEYDAAVLPVNMAAKLYSAGIPIRLAAIVGNGMVSFLSSDPGVSSILDLRGAEVHVAGQGATPDFLFRRLLKSAGIDPGKEIRLSYALPYAEAATALAAGAIKNAILPEPFVTMALMANPSLRKPIDIDALWKAETGQSSYPMSALVIGARLASSPLSAATLLDACKESIEWVRANPRAAGELVERLDLGLKATVAERAIPRTNYVFMEAPGARPGVEALLRVFLETAPASIGGRLPDDGFYVSLR